MKIIFDLDYTLLDTARFKKDLADIFAEQDFEADYQRHFKEKRENFDFEKYLDILEDEGKIGHDEREKLKMKLKKLMGDLDNYLKPGAENVLKHFKDSGVELILMTFGNKAWQAEKVKHLSISRYFDEIIFEDTDKHKSEYLRSLSEGDEEILIINDNLGESEAMLEVLKRGKLLLVQGDYNRDRKPDIKDLSELIPGSDRKRGRDVNEELKLK